ncbi:MAG: hypothetical protein R2851_22220 [Caldilineaceae bacterium]
MERGDWDEDFWLAQADTLLPPDDDVTRDELAQIAAALRTLPQTDATYGMTHGDFGPQNFRYDPGPRHHRLRLRQLWLPLVPVGHRRRPQPGPVGGRGA